MTPVRGIVHLEFEPGGRRARARVAFRGGPAVPRDFDAITGPVPAACSPDGTLDLQVVHLATDGAAAFVRDDGTVAIAAGALRVFAEGVVRHGGSTGAGSGATTDLFDLPGHFPPAPTDSPLLGSIDRARGDLRLEGRISLTDRRWASMDLHAIRESFLARPVARVTVTRAGNDLLLDGTRSLHPPSPAGDVPSKLVSFLWSFEPLGAEGGNGKQRWTSLGHGALLELRPPGRGLYRLDVFDDRGMHGFGAVLFDPQVSQSGPTPLRPPDRPLR